jgi:hypothetical protein
MGDRPHLNGKVGGHDVDIVGEILPCPADPVHASLSSELAVRADLLGDSRHLGREVVKRLDHVVDRILELQNLSLGVYRD